MMMGKITMGARLSEDGRGRPGRLERLLRLWFVISSLLWMRHMDELWSWMFFVTPSEVSSI